MLPDFADLLRRDGYVVNASKEKFSKESLSKGKILVIANALNESNKDDWSPPKPSAFTDEEVTSRQSPQRISVTNFAIHCFLLFRSKKWLNQTAR